MAVRVGSAHPCCCLHSRTIKTQHSHCEPVCGTHCLQLRVLHNLSMSDEPAHRNYIDTQIDAYKQQQAARRFCTQVLFGNDDYDAGDQGDGNSDGDVDQQLACKTTLQTQRRPSVDQLCIPSEDQAGGWAQRPAWPLPGLQTWSTSGLHLVLTCVHKLVSIPLQKSYQIGLVCFQTRRMIVKSGAAPTSSRLLHT